METKTIAYSIRRECDETESTLRKCLNERRTNVKEGRFNSSKFVCTESDKIFIVEELNAVNREDNV